MASSPFHVIVIGGGLGGLCLAQGLHKAGISVAVYERDRTSTDRLQGYRIHIEPQGNRALAACLPADLFKRYLATSGSGGNGFRISTD
jgi:salicylate hydroxylase